MDKIKNERILIDANVLIYCGDKGYGPDGKKLLRTLQDNGNKLAASEMVCFEVIKNTLNPQDRKYYLSLINYLAKISISSTYLLNGALYYHDLYEHFKDKDICKGIESGDLIISGTVINQKGTLLLTANRKHFPVPFWKLRAQCHFLRKKDERDELINIYLLEFDYSHIKLEEQTEPLPEGIARGYRKLVQP